MGIITAVGDFGLTDLINQAKNALTNTMDAIENFAIQQNTFANELSEAIAGVDPDWIDLSASTEMAALDSATVDLPIKTINVPAGQRGRGTNIKRRFTLSQLSGLAIGDTVRFRFAIVESAAGMFETQDFRITIKANNQNIAPVIQTKELQDDLIEFVFSYTAQALTDEIEITLTIGTAAQTHSSAVAYVWDALGATYKKVQSRQTVEQIVTLVDNVKELYTHFQAGTIYSKCLVDGSDQSERLQDEINDAIARGSDFIPALGKTSFASPINIRGALLIEGINNFSRVFDGGLMSGVDADMFRINTEQPVFLQNFRITRTSSAIQTAIRFMTAVMNLDSRIHGVIFDNVVRSVIVKNTSRLAISKCEFITGEYPISIGYDPANGANNSPLSCNWTSVEDCDFYNGNNRGIYSLSANNLFLRRNNFRSDGLLRPSVCMHVYLTSGTHNNLLMESNTIDAFRNYGLLVEVLETATLDEVVTVSNKISDIKSTQSINGQAVPMAFRSDTVGKLKTVAVDTNILGHRLHGLYIDKVQGVNITSNILNGIGTGARAFFIRDSTYGGGLNAKTNQSNLGDAITNSSPLYAWL